MKKIADLIQAYWLLIGLFCTGLGSAIGFTHTYIVMPIIDSHIDNRVMLMANDSLSVMIDQHLTSKGGGFRGALSDSTGIKKDDIVDTLSRQILGEDKIKRDIQTNANALEYQEGYNFFLLKNIADKYEHKGVTFWYPTDGNVYFRDMYGLVWDAKFDAYDDCYYFYPSYANGNRLKCEL